MKGTAILMIMGGIVGNLLAIGYLFNQGLIPTIQESSILEEILLFLPAILTLIGGVMAWRKVHYWWALVGAIASLISPILGIPALILVIKNRSEFE